MTLRRTHLLIAIAGALLFPGAAHAVDRTFSPVSGNDWNTAENWTGSAVPGPGDKAIVNGTSVVVGTTPATIPDHIDLRGGGTISVSSGAALAATSSMTIVAGTLTGPGALTVAPGSITSIGALNLMGGLDFTVGTTTTWGGHIQIEGDVSTTSLVVPGGATMTHAVGGSIQSGTSGDSARFVNHGTFAKSTSGDTHLNVRFLNAGTVDVSTGFLRMGSKPPDGQRHTGDFVAAAGASLALHGDLGSGASFSGAGEATYSGGDSGDTIAAGATVPVDVASLRFAGAMTFGSGSSLAVSTAFRLVGGTVLQGPGSIDFAPGSTLSLNMGGQLNLPSGFLLTLPPGNGTSWTSGTIVSSTGGPAIVVPTGATFPLLDGGHIAASTSAEQLVNNGTIVKTGLNKTIVNSILTNSGLIDVREGKLGGSTVPTVRQDASGQIGVAAGAGLESHAVLDGGAARGHGEIWYVTNNAGTIEPGAAAERGTLSGRGFDQRGGGTLAVEIADTTPGTGFDRYLLSERADLGGTLAIQTVAGFTPSPGQSFQIMTFASRTGTFANVTGADLGGGFFFDVRYSATDVKLVVAGGPDPDLSINDVSVTEGDSGNVNAVFTASLSTTSADTVTVDFATANGSAVAPGDYTAANGTLTFAPGETSKTITVAVQGDALDEPNETFNVNLSNAVNAVLSDAQGVGTITDDDGAPSLSIDDVSAGEGTNAVFTVSLSAASAQTVTADFATANGSAVAPADYTASSGSLTFAPGETSKRITVSLQGDTLDESNESFTVNLSNAVNASIGDGQGIGTIVDDDGGPSLSINDVSVTEGNTGAVNAVFTVSLSTASGQSVNVDFATADGSAAAPGDYTATNGTLGFAPGETSKTITVAVQGDTLDELDEIFAVNLSNAANAAIGDGQGAGTIVDDDLPPNQPPNAADDSASLPENSGATAIPVLANDSDPNGDPLTITAVTQGAHGAVAITGGGAQLTYDPAQGYVGPDSFTYTIGDGRGGSDTATVAITVTLVNVDPNAVDDSASVPNNAGPTAIDVLANDTDGDGDALRIADVTQGTHGAVAITGGGTGLTYDPPQGYSGPDSFTYTVSDGNGGRDAATVAVTVEPPLGANKIVFSSTRTGNGDIYVMNADGSAQTRLTATSAVEGYPALSPDGKRVAFTRNFTDVFVINLDGTGERKLADGAEPAWSPDGRRIAFVGGIGLDIYVMNADGSGQRRVGGLFGSADLAPAWSPDGKKLVYSRTECCFRTDLFVAVVDGPGDSRLTNTFVIQESEPTWSPDGTTIVFARSSDLYAMNANGTGQPRRLTSNPGREDGPSWSPDGRKLAFAQWSGGADIYLMNADGSGQTRITTDPAYDVSPDW